MNNGATANTVEQQLCNVLTNTVKKIVPLTGQFKIVPKKCWPSAMCFSTLQQLKQKFLTPNIKSYSAFSLFIYKKLIPFWEKYTEHLSSSLLLCSLLQKELCFKEIILFSWMKFKWTEFHILFKNTRATCELKLN